MVFRNITLQKSQIKIVFVRSSPHHFKIKLQKICSEYDTKTHTPIQGSDVSDKQTTFPFISGLNEIYIIFITRMGNQFQVPNNIKEEWEQIIVKGSKLLRNKYTFEVFNLLVLQKVHQEENISKLVQRSIYSMPGTPKIIILSDQPDKMYLMVQQFQFSLAQHVSKLVLPVEILELVQKMAKIVWNLFRKYGPFYLSQKMFGLNSSLDVLGWIHSQKHKNQPELSCERNKYSEKIIVNDMLSLIKSETKLDVNQIIPTFFRNTFDELTVFLSAEIRKKKFFVANQAQDGTHSNKLFKRALSPQTSFGSYKLRTTKNMNFKMISPRGKKNIPQFIQKKKSENKNLLDSLNHRRTLTIEEVQTIANEKKRQNFIKQTVKKRQKGIYPSIGRIKSVRQIKSRDKNYHLSIGDISKVSYPSQKQILTSSNQSSQKMIKKRQFSDLKSFKSSKNIGSTIKKNSYQDKYPKTPNAPNTSHPYSFDVQQSFLEENTHSCVFTALQKQEFSPIKPMKEASVDYLHCIATNQSKYLGSISKSKVIVEEECPQTISKTLEDKINDLFSNPSKSPRFMLGPMKESLDIQKEFEKLIDL